MYFSQPNSAVFSPASPPYFRTCVSVHRRDRCTCTLINQGLRVDRIIYHHCTTKVQLSPRILLSLLSCATLSSLPPSFSFRTCVSVHRRDRCTRTPLPFFVSLSVSVPLSPPGPLVLACLSIDVTGALVLPPLLPFSFPSSLSLYWRVCP